MELLPVLAYQNKQPIHVSCSPRNCCWKLLECYAVHLAGGDVGVEPYPLPTGGGYINGIEHKTSKAVDQVRTV